MKSDLVLCACMYWFLYTELKRNIYSIHAAMNVQCVIKRQYHWFQIPDWRAERQIRRVDASVLNRNFLVQNCLILLQAKAMTSIPALFNAGGQKMSETLIHISPRRLLFTFLAKEITFPQLLILLNIKKNSPTYSHLPYLRGLIEAVSNRTTSLRQVCIKFKENLLGILSSLQSRPAPKQPLLTAPLPSLSTWSLLGALLHTLGSLAISSTSLSTKSTSWSTSQLCKWRSTSMARVSAAITACWAVASLIAGGQMHWDLMFKFSYLYLNLL